MSAYTDSVDHNLKGLQAVSTGVCPGCSECADDAGFETVEAFTAAYEAGEVYDEGGFSSRGCGICDSGLGGDLYKWHAIAGEPGDDLKGRDILHFDDACVDCVMYLANGDEPEGDR